MPSQAGRRASERTLTAPVSHVLEGRLFRFFYLVLLEGASLRAIGPQQLQAPGAALQHELVPVWQVHTLPVAQVAKTITGTLCTVALRIPLSHTPELNRTLKDSNLSRSLGRSVHHGTYVDKAQAIL